MAAPEGNKNAVKNKPWADALSRALEIHKPSDQRVKLDALACSLVEKAMSGDTNALKEIGDRLDGKPKQQIEATGLDGGAIEISRIERVITDPANRNP